MTDSLRPPVMLVGLIRLREHCAFTWEEPVGGGRRVARVHETHCAECVAELLRLGYFVMHEDAQEKSARGR